MNNCFPTSLYITDIERLAKAGVAVSLANIAPIPDPFPPNPQPTMCSNGMQDAIWDRWHRAKSITYPLASSEGFIKPYDLLASVHGDKVFVSVHPASRDHEPFMLEDVAAIFPSDALMAKLALWEKEHLP